MATIPTAPPPQIQRQLATRTHGKRIVVILLLIFGGAIAGATYLLRTKGKPVTEATVTAPTARPWLKQAETYPDPEKPVEKPPVQPVDTISPELARLRNELLAMKLKIEELDKRVVFQKWRWPCLHCPSKGIAVDNTTWKVMSQISDALKHFPCEIRG